MTEARPRLVGYDLARALAFFGMVLVNFKIVMCGLDPAGPEWLRTAMGLLEGRAAATFVVLAGVGLSLLSARARETNDEAGLAARRNTLLRRAAFLFLVGLAYTPLWPADILHFYGIYIALGAFALALPSRWLWAFIVAFVLDFVILMALFDYEAGWNWETLHYEGFWSPLGLVRHLFFNGFHPVIPWTAFLLLGMWLGRQDVASAAVRRRLLLWGTAVALAIEGASRLALASVPPGGELDEETLIALLGTGPMPPLPQYMVAAGATAVVVIVLCLGLAQQLEGSRWLPPLVWTGQLALTLYVAHVLVGMGTLEALGMLGGQSLPVAATASAIFCLWAVLFAWAWRARFQRGPLEALMRRMTD